MGQYKSFPPVRSQGQYINPASLRKVQQIYLSARNIGGKNIRRLKLRRQDIKAIFFRTKNMIFYHKFVSFCRNSVSFILLSIYRAYKYVLK